MTITPFDLDARLAQSLGFPKPEYIAIERERRWLCAGVPRVQVRGTEAITDLYVTGTRLRLREARPLDGSAPMLRLTRKADVDRHTRLITSIYLPDEEFTVLAGSLRGSRLKKLQHRLHAPPGVSMLVDEFQDELTGLFIAEAEFVTHDALLAFPAPDFVGLEVTDDPRYGGASLAKHGLPRPIV